MPANPRLTHECPPTARAPTVLMWSHVQADPNTIPACKAQFPPRQSPTPTAGIRGSIQSSPAASVVGASVMLHTSTLTFSPLWSIKVSYRPIWSSALVQASSSLFISRTRAWPRSSPSTKFYFHHGFRGLFESNLNRHSFEFVFFSKSGLLRDYFVPQLLLTGDNNASVLFEDQP